MKSLLGNSRRFPRQPGREELFRKTNDRLEKCGIPKHTQANYSYQIARYVVGNSDFEGIQPKIKVRKSQAWTQAFYLVLSFLKEYQMDLTSKTIKIELAKIDYPQNVPTIQGKLTPSLSISSLIQFMKEDGRAFPDQVNDFSRDFLIQSAENHSSSKKLYNNFKSNILPQDHHNLQYPSNSEYLNPMKTLQKETPKPINTSNNFNNTQPRNQQSKSRTNNTSNSKQPNNFETFAKSDKTNKIQSQQITNISKSSNETNSETLGFKENHSSQLSVISDHISQADDVQINDKKSKSQNESNVNHDDFQDDFQDDFFDIHDEETQDQSTNQKQFSDEEINFSSDDIMELDMN